MKKPKKIAIIMGIVIFLGLLASEILVSSSAILVVTPNIQLANTISLILISLMVFILLFVNDDIVNSIILIVIPLLIFSLKIILDKNFFDLLYSSLAFLNVLEVIPSIILFFIGYEMLPNRRKKYLVLLGTMGILATLSICFLGFITDSMSPPESQSSVNSPFFVYWVLFFSFIIIIGIVKIFKETRAEELGE